MATDDNCACCYGEAREAGRPVRVTDAHPHPVCGTCEARIRNGLLHYSPSNGSEFDYFMARCVRCRHFTDDGESTPSMSPPFKSCAWGVLDRVMCQMPTREDHASRWFDPADLATRDGAGKVIAPARCLRFTDKRDGDGALRDPPRPDVEGQLFLGEMLTVVEVVPATIGGPK